jgi:hypothetical protein
MFQAGAAGAQQPSRAAADSDSTALRRDGVATSGLSGLVNIPTAAVLPSGTVEFAFTNARTPESFQLGGWQRNAFIAFGFLPRVTVGLRGTVYPDTLANAVGRDLSENVEILLLRERDNRPAVAIGGFDALSAVAPYFRTFYAVASKSVGPYLALSAGVASGPRTLKGPFGGAELKVAPWVSGLGDFDGRKFGLGVRLDPFPATAYRLGLQPRIDVVWRQNVGAAFNVGLRTYMGRWPGASPSQPPPAAPERAASSASGLPALAAGLDALRHDLADAGFENVKVAVGATAEGTTVAVDYENRRYNRDELDALGVVMAITARDAPTTVSRMQVTIRRLDLAVITVASSVRDFTDFVDGRLAPEAFANQLQISDRRPAMSMDESAPVINRSRFKLDVFAQPIVHTAVLNEVSAFQEQSTLSADGWVQLAPGVTVNGRRTIAWHRDALFPPGFFDTNTDRLLLHAAAPIATPSSWGSASAITQLSIGRFGHYSVGVADEVNVSLAGGRVSLDGTVGAVGRSTRELNTTIALAGARVRIAPLDLTASLTAGRFLEGDDGATAELSRWFGSSELGLYATATRAGQIAGVRFSLPLTPTRELPPWRVRPRLPDVYTQSLHASIKRGDATAKTNIGLTLDTDHDIARAYRDRDRLQAVTIRQHVETIRASAIDWNSRGRS